MFALQFGSPKADVTRGGCCGKPTGCLLTVDGCLYLQHPWKQAHVFGNGQECGAECIRPHPDTGQMVVWRCVKKHTFVRGAGDCEIVPTKRAA